MKKLLAALGFVLLTACGGGGGSSAPTSPAAVAVAAAVVVDAYGDSTMTLAVDPVGDPPTHSQVAQSDLRAAGMDATVNNFGKGGQHAYGAAHEGWADLMSASKAQVVSINFAINDYGYPIEDYRANMELLVSVAQKAGKKVIIETPNPVPRVTYDNASLALRAQIGRDVAAKYGATLCDYWTAFYDNGLVNPTYIPDDMHPGRLGHVFKGHLFAACIRKAIG